ncbi:unnamed protein product [Rhizoctonia solani]|uniref:Uncharacterized protein n=1 Tax=Rhizoctonia solani TaxID=456999 RepID=A0A8H3ACJ6_9AGAM|nr:unnamed protein product [Rhizoctonia solani]
MWIKPWMKGAAIVGVVRSNVDSVYASVTRPRQTSTIGTISWMTCPDVNSTQCAFLDVPMDGPGGSGATSIVTTGEYLSTIVDRRYDIIGFDPRAVNLTGPSTACHDVEYKFAQRVYQLNMQGAPFPHVGGAGEIVEVAKLAAIQSSHHTACVENGNHEMLRNSGTVAVAKDMERIVEALGEDGLNFLGYSYGTILGATFAAMRPNLVKRMVLDGVSDAEAYFGDVLQWGRSGTQDTHKTWEGFISTCIDAGPTQCALAATRDNKTETIEGLKKRLDALYTQLGKEPLVVGDSSTGPGIIQAHNIQLAVFSFMYNPYTWPDLAQALALLEQGHGKEYYPIVNGLVYGTVPEPYTQNVFNRSMQRYSPGTRESQYPTLCGDSPQLNITVEGYNEYFREMGQLSPMGEQLALIVGGCRGWSFRATERYTGPWTIEKGLNKTRFPILFVSLDADPITPLSAAVKMSKGFGSDSATLLIQQGFGHTSTAHPSLCTTKNIHDYFVEGKVPKNGTHCTPEPGWIYPSNTTNSKRSTLSKRDKDFLGAAEKIARSRIPSGF